MRIGRHACVEQVVDAPLEAVWTIVSNATRTGEWSGECVEVRWLGGADAAAPGVRFRGRNRNRLVRWTRTCEVVQADPPRELAWRTLPSLMYPDSTEWRLSLEPVGDRTRVVQSFRVTKLPRWAEWVFVRAIPGHADRSAELSQDLRRLGALAARETATASAAIVTANDER